MVTYASGSIRFTGLGSDYNFDEMVSKLAAIESRQVTQLMQWQQDWKNRLEAIKAIRGELMNLQSTLKSLNTMSSFLAKGATSSDDKIAMAVADGDAMNTSYNVVVNRLATYSTWTKDPGWSERTETVADADGSFSYSYKGVYRTVNVPKGTTVEGLIKLINNDSKNPGVRAQVIQSVDGLTFQLRGLDTGKANTLVIRDTQNIRGLDVALTPANYVDGENFAKLNASILGANLGDSINTGSEAKTFIYTVDGVRRTINVEPGESIRDLANKINSATPGLAGFEPPLGPGDTPDPGTAYTFVLKKEDTVYTASYDEEWHQSNTGTGPFESLVGTKNADGTWLMAPKEFASRDSKILDPGDPPTEFKLTVTSSDGTPPDNQTYSFSVNENTTLSDLMNQIKFQLGDRVEVKMVSSPGGTGYCLGVDLVDKSHRVTVENGSLEELSYVPPSDASWDVLQGDNAQVRINGVPSESSGKWLEVAGNTLKSGEVMTGITFTLLKEGETNISIYDDTQKMTENIQKFVDAVNSFRTVLKSYTDYDAEKQTVDLEYSESLFDMQKGGILQGNYGIQMVSSRLKDCIARSATGFMHRVHDADGYALSGDLFSSLSQIGITTNATQGEINYGLLEINYISNLMGSKTLEEAIAEDPRAVAELFALQGEGKSNSDFFHFDSYVPGITSAGTHEVSYKVDGSGNIYDAYINGVAASVNNDTHSITATDGTAKGLVVNVVNYDQQGDFSGTVSIKEGKINDMLRLLEGTEGLLGSSGTLRNLEKNYQSIIDGIEGKIKREDERLAKWERTMLLKFSRLESVLARYNQMQGDLESQLAQLGTSKSS